MASHVEEITYGSLPTEVLDSQEDPDFERQEQQQDPCEYSVNSSAKFPSEIPDSQESCQELSLEHLSSDPTRRLSLQDLSSSASGCGLPQEYSTFTTLIIPGGTRLLKRKPKYPLHEEGTNVNGRLPGEAPGYVFMEDEATQPATQPYFDPRRDGESNSMNRQDESDIICILLPTSPEAYTIVTNTAKTSPQHVLRNLGLSSNLDSMVNDEPEPPRDAGGLALRISSRVKDICMGFIFGRNAGKCDIVIDIHKEKMKISNMHFRIFVNQNGIIMLEDTSSNGTWIDDERLSCKDKEGHSKRMLEQGSVIEVYSQYQNSKEPIRFVVTIPNRDHAGDEYKHHLQEYIELIDNTEKRAAAMMEALIKDYGTQPPLVSNGPRQALPAKLVPSAGLHSLTAGSERYNYGMHWNGGDKYNVVSHIGKGAFANVYQVATKKQGDVYAVKELEKRKFMKSGILSHKMHNELEIMTRLHHPHIVQLIDSHETDKFLYIVMEFVKFGDLSHYVAHEDMSEAQGRSLCRQMSHALKYLHNCGITHRDIKPENVLIKNKSPLIVKLSDFGLSKAVKDGESLLKTFCGTLLYCAPEVYPDYQIYKLGLGPRKRRRPGEPTPQGIPYSSAIDIWSFAAVAFHLICGQPPWEGSAEDRGAIMLQTIMTKPCDLLPLKKSGVSEEGIDFFRSILVTDPLDRPTAKECLDHPWIMEATDVIQIPFEADERPVDLERIVEEDKLDEAQLEINASQLSLIDQDLIVAMNDSFPQDDCSSVDEIPLAKRSRLAEAAWMPALVRQQGHLRSSHAQPSLLFGEIGASDLRSSGILGPGMEAAPQVSFGADGSYDRPNVASSFQSAQPVFQHPILLQGPYQNQPVGSAPSLLGAETEIGQLNMASPESGFSAPNTPSTVQSGEGSQSSITATVDNRFLPIEDKNVTPENRRAFVEKGFISSAVISTTQSHKLQSHTSGKAAVSREQIASFTPNFPKHTLTKLPLVDDLNQASHTSGPSKIDAQRKDQISPTTRSVDNRLIPSTPIAHASQTQSQSTTAASQSSTQVKEAGTDFAKPHRRFGKLIPVEGSIISTPIKLEQQVTTWGRDPISTHVYPDPLDTRIPKAALDIYLWRPGMEREIQGGADWLRMTDLRAVVQTRCSNCIMINNVKLTRGRDEGWLYGILRQGDTITIFDDQTGFLKFRCEFYHGLSQFERGPDEPFVVEKEVEKFKASVSRRSSPASFASD